MPLQGLDKLIKRLDRIEKGEGLREGIKRACREVVERAAVRNCPVDTGNLQSSITSETPKPSGPPVGVVGTNVEYAPYVEMGTGIFAQNGDGSHTPWVFKGADGRLHVSVGQKPQPFLQPALRDNEDEIRRLIAEGVKKDIEG